MFRDERIKGEDVRVAYIFIPVPSGLPPVLVQVAETRNKREALASPASSPACCCRSSPSFRWP